MGYEEPDRCGGGHCAAARVGRFSTALDHLVKVVEDGALEDLDANGMVGFFQAVEQVRNRIPLIDHVAIAHAVQRELPASLCQRSIGRVLAASLRLLRSDSLPDSGGTPTSLVIIVDADDLEKRTGVGHFLDGSPIRADRVIDLADQAAVTWCLKNTKGAVPALGRSRRLASPAQTVALTARDGGCSFPGCDSPPEWSERHHIVSWLDGGSTDLDNLTLLCRCHHHNSSSAAGDVGSPLTGFQPWIPPKWVDRDQRPIVHPRILIERWCPQDPLPAADPLW